MGNTILSFVSNLFNFERKLIIDLFVIFVYNRKLSEYFYATRSLLIGIITRTDFTFSL